MDRLGRERAFQHSATWRSLAVKMHSVPNAGQCCVRVLELPAGKTSREWGRIHGESFRGEVKALSEIRTYLCTKVGGFKT
ncbi:MAG: hypothetical protein ABI175_05370, partial [Polyangiales bacterium]